jgi:hypothetical protein
MTSLSDSGPSLRLDPLRTIRPARGTCRVVIEINGVEYVARPIAGVNLEARRLIRLRKADGRVYYVSEHDHGAECDCPDFIFHRDGIDPTGCKHIKALAACGLLSHPPAVAETCLSPTLQRWARTARETIELERDEIRFGPAVGSPKPR